MTDRRPFRVLVTRPRDQGSRLAELLAAAGAEPILIPTIELVPPPSFAALDTALSELRSFDWLLFTSANAVRVFAERARATGHPANPKRIAAIGPATAQAVETLLGRPVDRMPARFVAEALAEALLADAPGSSMLLVRAAVARDVVPDALKANGARMTIVDAYRTVVPEDSIAQLQQLFASELPHAITFTSASTVQNLAALLDRANVAIPQGTLLASIGPVTSQAMRELCLEPTVEAREATLASLVAALIP